MKNFIEEYPNMLSKSMCSRIVDGFEACGEAVDGRTGCGVNKEFKDSRDLDLGKLCLSIEDMRKINSVLLNALVLYARKYPFFVVSALSPTLKGTKTNSTRAIDSENIDEVSDEELSSIIKSQYTLDNINIQRYEKDVGGYFRWHSEQYPSLGKDSLSRVLLWLLYLNDVEVGGTTEFYHQKVRVKPEAGKLILSPCGYTHTHRGNPPVSSRKYVLASWIKFRPAEVLYR
jgi:hypothetical protein